VASRFLEIGAALSLSCR